MLWSYCHCVQRSVHWAGSSCNCRGQIPYLSHSRDQIHVCWCTRLQHCICACMYPLSRRVVLTCRPAAVVYASLQEVVFPLYDQVKSEHVVPGMRALLKQLHAEIDALEASGWFFWRGRKGMWGRKGSRDGACLCGSHSCTEKQWGACCWWSLMCWGCERVHAGIV